MIDETILPPPLLEEPDFLFPATLTRLLIDHAPAELMRFTILRVHAELGNVEIAFLLGGHPPTLSTPARVTAAVPMASTSRAASVEVSPQAGLQAHQWLQAQNPQNPAQNLGIAHCHPDHGKPMRSSIDQRWHRDCLDMNYRPDLVLPVTRADENEPQDLQVFYSVIFPSTGQISLATSYLLARPVGSARLLEVEIDHACTESEESRSQVAGLCISPQMLSPSEYSITYQEGTYQKSSACKEPGEETRP